MSFEYCNGAAKSNLKVIKVKPVNALNMNWLIFKMYTRGEYQFCKDLIERQMQDNNFFDHEYLYYVQGLILVEENDLQAALKSFQKTLEFNSRNSANYKEIAKVLYKMGRFRQSLEVFLKAESYLERPDHEIYHHIGEIYSMNLDSRAKINEAKEYYKRAIMNGKQIPSYKKLSLIYRKDKDYPKAIELLESSLQVAQGNIDLYTDLGIMYLKINEVDRAFEKLQEAIALNEKHTASLLALGAILQSKSDIEGALGQYRKIPDIQEEGSEIWSNIGMCFFKKNKLIAAIACLKKALWISPLNFNVLFNLGVVLMAAKQFASAFQCFVAAVSLRPESSDCFMLLAVCLYYLHDLENAQVAFKKSLLFSSAIKNPLIYLNYAIFCFECMNDVLQSQQYLSNFYNLCESIKVPIEYVRVADRLNLKLPDTMPLPETRMTSAGLGNTLTSPIETIEERESEGDYDNVEDGDLQCKEDQEPDGDLV